MVKMYFIEIPKNTGMNEITKLLKNINNDNIEYELFIMQHEDQTFGHGLEFKNKLDMIQTKLKYF